MVSRRFVEQTLAGIVGPASIDIVVLLTNELVTNAIVHAGTPIDVLVRDLHDFVQIEVFDAGKQIPAVAEGQQRPSRAGVGVLWRPSRQLGVFTLGHMARRSGFAARPDGPGSQPVTHACLDPQ